MMNRLQAGEFVGMLVLQALFEVILGIWTATNRVSSGLAWTSVCIGAIAIVIIPFAVNWNPGIAMMSIWLIPIALFVGPVLFAFGYAFTLVFTKRDTP